MLSNMVSKLGGLFGPRFAVSYLAPASVAGGALAIVGAVEMGVGRAVDAWNEMQASSSITAGVVVIVALVMSAYLLQSVTTPVLQLWEGRYLPVWLSRRWRAAQGRTAARLAEEAEKTDRRAPHPRRYFGFPHDPGRLRPTRLGNALAAAEEYPLEAYGLDGLLWWPRLLAVLPEDLRDRLDDANAPMVGFINLATVLLFIMPASTAILLSASVPWLPFWLPLVVGLPLAWLCYRVAVSHAVNFGTLVRVAFDLHRLDILRRMSIRVPENYEVERALWKQLNGWVGAFASPGLACPTAVEWMRPPFAYAPEKSD